MTPKAAFSPYLRREPMSRANPYVCYYCGDNTSRNRPAAGALRSHDATKDHVLAKVHGRTIDRVWNLRPCCHGCNSLRSTLGHCCGALMLCVVERQTRADAARSGLRHLAEMLGMIPSRSDILAARRLRAEGRRLAKLNEAKEPLLKFTEGYP
jgi:hypothetical protein